MRSHDRTVSNRCRAPIRDERGAAVVEFAIIFPLLIILLFGMVDFGRAFFLRNNLVAAAREGARLGAVATNPCGATSAIRARVRNYITSVGGASPTDAQLPVTFLYTDGSTSNCTSTTQATNVRVGLAAYPFTAVTPVFSLINYTTAVQITVSATYRWEQSPVP